MARVHFVKKARKPIPSAGVQIGDSYYWWKFRTGGRGGSKHISKTPPKPSQLTQSEFLSSALALAEQFEEIDTGAELEDIASDLESLAEEVSSLGATQQERLDNMPDSLQNGPSGELLQTRAEACEALESSLREAADNIRDVEGTGEDRIANVSAVLSEVSFDVE